MARDAYHSKALAELSPMTSILLASNLRMLPIIRISLNIQNGGTWRISFESPCRDESETSSLSPSHLRMWPIFRISLNIQNGYTWRKSFESPCQVESDHVITFRIEPPDVADYSYLIKYSKRRHVTYIIRKPSQRWVRWRHHFPNRTSGCRRFFVSD